MELEHRFELPVGLDTAWETLTDIGKVGPCFPGSSVDSVDGDDFTGSVKLKFGRLRWTFEGKGSIVEKDPIAHRARIEASGHASQNDSTAAMLVTATASPVSANRTAVDLVTTLSITGRPAQFGRGVMVEVGNKLISQFADCVSKQLSGRTTGGAALVDVTNPDEVAAEVIGAEAETAPAPVQTDGGRSVGGHRVVRTVAPIDVGSAAAVPVLKRAIPIGAGVIGVFLLRKLVQRKPKSAD